MDWVSIGNKVTGFLKQNKYVVLVLVIGLALMLIPGEDKKETPQPVVEEQAESEGIQQELENILGHIDGVGRVKVMLTIAEGEHIRYEMDEDHSTTQDSGTTRTDTVIITDKDRGQKGLIKQIDPPTYQGAVVVCQGAGSPAVRLSVVEAVASVTGLTADRITVLKMK